MRSLSLLTTAANCLDNNILNLFANCIKSISLGKSHSCISTHITIHVCIYITYCFNLNFESVTYNSNVYIIFNERAFKAKSAYDKALQYDDNL